MLFNSLHFAIFFPVVVVSYFACPYRYRWLLLLLASYYFYMAWVPVYVLLLLFSTAVDYVAGRLMDATDSVKKRRKYLFMSLTANLGLLFFFKYFNFASDSLRVLFEHFSIPYHVPESRFLLPVGISFYTFQTMGYAIDVYRGNIKAERNPGIFALYVTFFPQLVAGPIERAASLLPQFRQHFDFDYKRVTDGLKLMAWGFFKKLVIADRVAALVDYVYADPQSHHGPALALATVFFAWQVFCDFSGYSDIAIGASRILGIELMTNFRRPFFATSAGDIWRRWHISLSSWFRDYLYFPMGGSRVKISRHAFNLIFVFSVCGIWHGADWTFMAWGTGHGLLLAASLLSERLRGRIRTSLRVERLPRLYLSWQVGITFFWFCFLLAIFRSNNVTDAMYVARHLFEGWLHPLNGLDFAKFIMSLGFRKVEDFYIAAGAILILETVHWLQEFRGVSLEWLDQRPAWVRWSLYYALLLLILNFGVFNASPFFYFQF